jgi:hypothetical protein
MKGEAKPAVSTDLPSQTSLITEASVRLLDVMNEAHVDVAKMTKKALSVLLAEESFKSIAPRYISTHKDLTMLLRYKDVLLTRQEEEGRMLKHVNQKSEYEHQLRVDQLEKLNSKLEQELLDVRCELVSCQKRLNFALARPPNSNPSSVVEASKSRRIDRYNTAVAEYEKYGGDRFNDNLHMRTVESENSHFNRGRTIDREEGANGVDHSMRRGDSTPLSREEIAYLKASKEKQLPSLLTKDRFPNLPSINLSMDQQRSRFDKSREHKNDRNHRDGQHKPESRSLLNADDLFEDRRKLRKDPSKRNNHTDNRQNSPTEEPSNSKNSSRVAESRIKSNFSGLGNSQKLRDELPSHGDNIHIDYHRFGVIGPSKKIKT